LAFSIPGARHIPLGQLRSRHAELDRSKRIIVFCAIGVRAYNAARILMNNGFENVKVYPGGVAFYRSTHYKAYTAPACAASFEDSGHEKVENAPTASVNLDSPSVRLDCTGLQCPGPIMRVFQELKKLGEGQTLEVTASDPGFVRDAAAWCRRTGNAFISSGRAGKKLRGPLKKGPAGSSGGGGVGCRARGRRQAERRS
jgi:TusA-related sulfurtransferase